MLKLLLRRKPKIQLKTDITILYSTSLSSLQEGKNWRLPNLSIDIDRGKENMENDGGKIDLKRNETMNQGMKEWNKSDHPKTSLELTRTILQGDTILL